MRECMNVSVSVCVSLNFRFEIDTFESKCVELCYAELSALCQRHGGKDRFGFEKGGKEKKV